MKKNSSIELLKVVGIIMIVIFHCYMTVTMTGNSFYPGFAARIDFASLPKGITKLVLLVAGYFGPLGNLIFIICSCWFLCRLDNIRAEKVILLLITAFVISLFSLGIIRLLNSEVDLSGKYIHDCFFPVAYGHNWFVTSYILIYCAHGGLNAAIRRMDRKTHLFVAVVLYFMYFVVPLYGKTNFFYSSHLTLWFSIYIITSYVRAYMSEVHKAKWFIVFGCAGFAYLVISKHFGFPHSIKDQGLLLWAKNTNPFLLLIGLGAVVLTTRKTVYNRAINYIAGLSILVYLFHENLSFRGIIRPLIWIGLNEVLGAGVSEIIKFVIFTFIVLAYGFGMSMLYNELVMPQIRKISGLIGSNFMFIWEIICNRLGVD